MPSDSNWLPLLPDHSVYGNFFNRVHTPSKAFTLFADSKRKHMPEKFVQAGGWRTLERRFGYNVPQLIARFKEPAGAEIKVRYGDGWPFGKDRQKQTLDGQQMKELKIGGNSTIFVARMQIRVNVDTDVRYDLFTPGP